MSEMNISLVFRAVNKIGRVVENVSGGMNLITRATERSGEASRQATTWAQKQAQWYRNLRDDSERLSRAKEELHASMMKVAAMNLAGSQVMQFGRAVGRPLQDAIGTAASFEKSMSAVRAITRATEDEFGVLEKEARRLGAVTQFSASQAAEGMRFLGMAGFDTNQIVAAMPNVADRKFNYHGSSLHMCRRQNSQEAHEEQPQRISRPAHSRDTIID